jgi:hypothetical protein
VADQGTGSTAVFTTNGFEGGVTFIDLSGSMSRGVVETTHLGTTVAKTFEPEDLYDGGEFSMTIDWIPNELNVTGGFLLSLQGQTVTITFSNSGADTYAATMFCTGVNWGPIAANERMTASVNMKVTGAVTIAT